ncbi:MAG: U32 family peptidase [Hespellia sp.]|nr:U32 family peptidase [Hespellia sp.]
MKKKEIEILAPAGSFISFKAAIAAGADAVYVGGSSFGARAFADNFTEEQLLEAIDYAHFHGRKIFLTVNTLLKEEEIQNRLYDYLLPYYLHGLDAVIVQDMGVLELVRECFPDLAVHASTQMTITNTLGAQFMKSKGVERIVPARELSLGEIREMAEATGLEIECFVHGALCYCYSGQCLLSSTIGGRSGNRGQCAQPCRLPYEAAGQRGYLLSPKDICTLELIPEMVEAGIYSFKIEGRMKKPEYVAAVTSMYRKYVDLYFQIGRENFKVEPMDKQLLMDIYNRGGFDEGYYKKHNSAGMISIDRPNHAGVLAFQVVSQMNREVKGKALVEIHKGDILELTKEDNYTFGQDVHKGDYFQIIVPKKKRYQKNTVLARTRNQYVLNQIDDQYVNQLVKEKIKGVLTLSVGRPASLEMTLGKVNVICEGDVVETAKNQPLSVERIRKQMSKTGNTEYEWSDLVIRTEGNIFLPMQGLNELRRKGLEQLKEAVCSGYYRTKRPDHCESFAKENLDTDLKMSVLVQTPEQLRTVLNYGSVFRIYIDSHIIPQVLQNEACIRHDIAKASELGKEIFFVMPYIFRADAVKVYEEFYEAFCRLAVHGVMIRNYESYQFLKDHSFEKTMILDHNMYIFNSYARKFWEKEGLCEWTAPVELSSSELSSLGLEGSEFIAYGRLPMMVSAGCIKKTTGKCDHKSEYTILKDRLKNEYIVKNYCDFCYNVMYNESPLVLYDQMKVIREMNPQSIRLQFSVEDEKETNRILKQYESALEGATFVDEPDFDFTRGHFRRGIR